MDSWKTPVYENICGSVWHLTSALWLECTSFCVVTVPLSSRTAHRPHLALRLHGSYIQVTAGATVSGDGGDDRHPDNDEDGNGGDGGDDNNENSNNNDDGGDAESDDDEGGDDGDNGDHDDGDNGREDDGGSDDGDDDEGGKDGDDGDGDDSNDDRHNVDDDEEDDGDDNDNHNDTRPPLLPRLAADVEKVIECESEQGRLQGLGEGSGSDDSSRRSTGEDEICGEKEGEEDQRINASSRDEGGGDREDSTKNEEEHEVRYGGVTTTVYGR